MADKATDGPPIRPTLVGICERCGTETLGWPGTAANAKVTVDTGRPDAGPMVIDAPGTEILDAGTGGFATFCETCRATNFVVTDGERLDVIDAVEHDGVIHVRVRIAT